jgi:26S proteasome regulatory subunit N8
MAPPSATAADATSSSDDAAVAAVSSAFKPPAVEEVIIHPLVLLSAADHYHRVARGTRKRVVGVLLGSLYRGKIDATNSFAVPFEEDSRNPVRAPALRCCSLRSTRDASVATYIPFILSCLPPLPSLPF